MRASLPNLCPRVAPPLHRDRSRRDRRRPPRILRVWRDLIDCRARLKADALAEGNDAPRRTTQAARRMLIEFDREVAVQTALATDVGRAAQHVLSILRIVKPRTMQRLLATSRANATTR